MTEPRSEPPADGHSARDVPGLSDQSLLERFRRGQEDASTALYLRYARRLHNLATARSSAELRGRTEPEDIVQSVFRTFFRRAAHGQYEAPEGGDLWKLLLVIALNKMRAAAIHHRAAKRDVRRTHNTGSEEAAVERAESGRDEQALTTLRLVVDEALERSPEAHRRIIERRIEGYEIAEIAAEIGRSKRTVERVLQDFRTRLDGLIHEAD